MLSTKFLQKVAWNGLVDTKKYRYVVDEDGYIIRLPIDWLDTTHAINEWETVCHVNNIYNRSRTLC